ncbi:MAG: glycosyltransferase [Candidatus Thermoplasmatota archaeon]|nr:glycosyltransferase [Candidatus Thermoplasmatota archaeon]
MPKKRRSLVGSVVKRKKKGIRDTRQTGVLQAGWSPANRTDENVVVQFGINEESAAAKNWLFEHVVKRLELKDADLIVVATNEGDIDCGPASSTEAIARGESEWYDAKSIMKELPHSWKALLLEINENLTGNSGILDNLEILRKSELIVVSNVESLEQHSVALRIAESVRGFIRVEKVKCGKKSEVSCAFIEPAAAVKTPAPLGYPSIKNLLPEGLIIPAPVGIGNDFQHLMDELDSTAADWKPKTSISIVIPLYNRRVMLGRTLAMLTHQTYPLDLMEIVIADDGSSDDPITMIDEYQKYFDVQYVRQEDLGYRLSEVRNLGIRAAKHDDIILLDCDMAPVPTMVEAYARRLDVSRRAVYCGHRRYVDANHISVDEVRISPSSMLALPDIETVNEKMKQDGHVLDWRLPMYRQSDNLRFEKYPFRAVCGGNIAFNKSLFERVGQFEEAFKAWGKEDTEWGFRVWNRGEYIIPVYEACGLHQEPPGGRNETDREVGLQEVMPTFIDRVPVMYRRPEHGVEHTVPLVSIYMPAYKAQDSIVETIHSVLDQSFEDIEVCIAIDGCEKTLAVLEAKFLGNPRVRWVFQENQGIGGASNTAVQMCRGVFIGQLDSDDLLMPNAVEAMLSEIQKDTRIGVVYGSFQRETPQGEFLSDGYDWPEYSREKLMFGCIIHHFRFFRARDWWRTQGFATDITNAVDFDMFLKMASITEMVHVKEWSYVYRIHEESTSIKQVDRQIMNHFVVVNKALKRLGLSDRWNAISAEDDNNPRRVEFVLKDENSGADGSKPFTRMLSILGDVAPPVVRHLASREETGKTWTMGSFPVEKIFERVKAIAETKSLELSDKELRKYVIEHGPDMWSIIDKLDDNRNY